MRDQRLRDLGRLDSFVDGCSIFVPIVRIAPEELPCEFGRLEVIQVSVGGLRPPFS
jgi:hypothetical protein